MQHLQLTIPEPCHENWHNMTPTDQGRFCNACAKEVIDFSTMTDIQVLNYFTTRSHEKICGRALPEQLERPISRPGEPKRRLFWYWNYVVMFFMFFAKGNNAKAQGGVKATTEIANVQASKTGEIKESGSRVATGKVTDIDGNPVSFATVKIKGAATGLSADANGAYYIRVHSNDILVISGASFIETEFPIGSQSVFNTVLEKGGTGQIVFTVGGFSWSHNEDYTPPPNQKLKAQLQVTDELNGQPIDKARITLVSGDYNREDTVYTDRKGKYKLKGIRRYDQYFVRIDAEGYEGNEFTISYKDVETGNKEWEVSLRKQKVVALKAEGETNRSVANAKPGTEQSIRLGKISAASIVKDPLYVIDGVIKKSINDISPDDIEEISILKEQEAKALFGADGSNSAIIITTRKQKIKDLKEVVVVSEFGTRRVAGATGVVCYVNKASSFKEAKVRLKTILTDSLKVFPNPVQRGNSFNVSLKLKQPGSYNIQVADAVGRIILQKQINTISAEYTEILQADSRWSGGVYYIRVFDNKTLLISKNSFIVQ